MSEQGHCAWNSWVGECVPSNRCEWASSLLSDVVGNEELCAVRASDSPSEASDRLSREDCVTCKCPHSPTRTPHPPPPISCAPLRCDACVTAWGGVCAWNSWSDECVASTECRWDTRVPGVISLLSDPAAFEECAVRSTDTPAEAEARAAKGKCVACRCG